MSERCNVAIVAGTYELMLYRHFDGVPVNLKYHLDTIVKWLKEERIPQHPGAVGSWLMLLEMDINKPYSGVRLTSSSWGYALEPSKEGDTDYRCSPSRYVPTPQIHGDITFFYVVDTLNKCWQGYKTHFYVQEGNPTPEEILAWHKIKSSKGTPHPDGDSFSSKTAQKFHDEYFEGCD